jgi:hypothetical protein
VVDREDPDIDAGREEARAELLGDLAEAAVAVGAEDEELHGSTCASSARICCSSASKSTTCRKRAADASQARRWKSSSSRKRRSSAATSAGVRDSMSHAVSPSIQSAPRAGPCSSPRSRGPAARPRRVVDDVAEAVRPALGVPRDVGGPHRVADRGAAVEVARGVLVERASP